jgi:hypothetical protein
MACALQIALIIVESIGKVKCTPFAISLNVLIDTGGCSGKDSPLFCVYNPL